MDNPKILDNSLPQFQLRTYLTDLLTSTKYTELSITTGYWDLPGMLELLPAFETFFETNTHSEIRFLLGQMDLLDTLAILSANLTKDEAPQKMPEPVLWFGWHSE